MSYLQQRKSYEFAASLQRRVILNHIDIELTERCNNRCIHCYINQPEHDDSIKQREMETSFIKDVLKQAANLGCLSVRFTGGEPLLREDFHELYLFARRLGLRVILFTNGRLITRSLCELFSKYPPGRPVEVSVYGMRASSYDAVAATRGAFDEFWRGLNLLQEYKIPFILKQSLLPQNRGEVPEFEAFSTLHMDHQPSYSMNFDLRARRDDPAKNQFIKNLRLSPEETLRVNTRDPEKFLSEMRRRTQHFFHRSGDRLFTCGAGHTACVDAYGNAQMCMLLRHPDTVYPLDPKLHGERNPGTQSSSLHYAFTEFFPQVRALRTDNPAYLSRCAVCPIRNLCEQCPAKSWEEHGTLDTPVDYLCEITHAKARYLGLLSANEHAWEIPDIVWHERINNFITSAQV